MKKKITALRQNAFARLVTSNSEDDADWEKPVRVKLHPMRGNTPLRKKHGIWVLELAHPNQR